MEKLSGLMEQKDMVSLNEKIRKKMLNKSKPQTVESQKEELGSSMDSSDHGTIVQREMMKIRKEGKMEENCVTDTHKIIYEAEKRVGKKKKDTEKYTKDK